MEDRTHCEACNTLEAYWEAKARAQEAMHGGLRDEIEGLQRRHPLSQEDKAPARKDRETEAAQEVAEAGKPGQADE